jgi:hypothetical protein
MKKTLLIFAMFVALMASSSLKAQTILDFTLVNNTGEDLYGVYVSETVNESWGKDIIPTDIFKTGFQVEVKFNDEGEATCNWDIKLTKDAAEENSVLIEDVNLCGITKLTLNKEDGKYTYFAE